VARKKEAELIIAIQAKANRNAMTAAHVALMNKHKALTAATTHTGVGDDASLKSPISARPILRPPSLAHLTEPPCGVQHITHPILDQLLPFHIVSDLVHVGLPSNAYT
jgi:hypothetical protein